MNKVDKVNHVVGKSHSSFCFACLSSDRNLTRINELDGYCKILLNITNYSIKISDGVCLCWECVAILKKIKLFEFRIKKAQSILANKVAQAQETINECLSRLSSANTDNVIFITHDDDDHDDEKGVLSTLKQEINKDEDSNLDQDDTHSDHCLEEIKKENQPASKCVKRNKVSHYRIVYGPNIFKKSLLRKKFSIKPEEVLMWLERDRDSKFYKLFKFRCKLCINGFNCKEKLMKHYAENHQESLGAYACPICHVRFASEPSLSAHTQLHAHAHECARCGYQCYSVRRLNAHLDTHRLVQCVYCDVCLPDVHVFHQHYKAMHSVFLCDHCGKRCRTKYMLEKHITRHFTSHTCQSCSRHYKSRAALNKHRATKHSADIPEDAYCVHCDKQFDSVLVYRRHVQNTSAHAHENDKTTRKKVQCPECDNTYSRRAYMLNHYRHVHANQSKYYCAHCNRHFLNRTRYVDHMRFNHEGVKREKNKLCNVCGRGFTTNRILVNHIRTHSGERPFECEYCSAKFSQKHSMMSHVKYIHLKSKRRVWQQ